MATRPLRAGARAFSRALDDELRGRGIRIKVVSPGPVDTRFILDDLDRVTDLTLSQPMSTAAQVAEAAIDAILNDAPGAVRNALLRAAGAFPVPSASDP